MNYINLQKRIRNASKRKKSASIAIMRRSIFRILNLNLSAQTEVQYIELGFLKSKIIYKKVLYEAKNYTKAKNKLNYEHNFNTKYLVRVSDVVVNTETCLVYATDNSGHLILISESTEWPAEHAIIYSEKPPRKIYKKLEHAALGLPNSGFAHLMSEDLPNLLAVESKRKFLFYEKSSSLNHQIFSILKYKKYIVPKWIYVKELEMVTKEKDLGYMHPQSVKIIKSIRNNLLLSSLKTKTRIYISRTDSTRSFKQEKEIQKIFSDLGFLVIYPEKLSFREQIMVFSNAKVVAGIHGAGLFNTIWSDSCSVVEFMPINRINRCFEWQSSVVGNSYDRIFFDEKNFSLKEIKSQISSLNLH